MGQHEADASECLEKRNFFFDNQIGTFAFEILIFYLLDHNYHIASFTFGYLVTFSMDNLLAAIG